MFHRSGLDTGLVRPYVPSDRSRPGRGGAGRGGAGRGRAGGGAGKRVQPVPANAGNGDRCRRRSERSQADRGFDGEPPLDAGHFGLGTGMHRIAPEPGSTANNRSHSSVFAADVVPATIAVLRRFVLRDRHRARTRAAAPGVEETSRAIAHGISGRAGRPRLTCERTGTWPYSRRSRNKHEDPEVLALWDLALVCKRRERRIVRR